MIQTPQNNPYSDRITEILQRRAQAQAPNVPYEQAASLAFNNSLNRAIGGSVTNVYDAINQVRQQKMQQQDAGFQREMDVAQNLYDTFEAQKAAGNKQAQALDEKLRLFTDGDPDGMAAFLQELESDPEDIDPSNAFQVMTKLAEIKKRTGYMAPSEKLAQLDMQLKQMGLKQKEASISATRALEKQRLSSNQRSSGASGVKPQSPIGKIAADYASGIIDKPTYNALIAKQTGAEPMGDSTPKESQAKADPLRPAKMTEAQRKDRDLAVEALNALKDYESALYDENGNLRRVSIGAGSYTSAGRDIYQPLRTAIANNIYLKTGAAATPGEIDSMMEQYQPSVFDTEQQIKRKLDSLRLFLQQKAPDYAPYGLVGQQQGAAADAGGLSPEERAELEELEREFGGGR